MKKKPLSGAALQKHLTKQISTFLRELAKEYPSESPEHKVLERTLKQLGKILRKQRCQDSSLR